jgi:beta-lactamase regulating signal transducer with metallopeptidase domain
MLDTNLLIMIVVVAVAGVLVYIVERYTKKKQVEWMDAAKIGLLSGAGAGGLLYAVGGDVETVVTSTVATASSAVQDMFVGKPSF